MVARTGVSPKGDVVVVEGLLGGQVTRPSSQFGNRTRGNTAAEVGAEFLNLSPSQ